MNKNAPDTQKSESKNNRRSAVKKVLAGGGVLGGAAITSSTWVKPVVNSVLLPAHAQGTDAYSG